MRLSSAVRRWATATSIIDRSAEIVPSLPHLLSKICQGGHPTHLHNGNIIKHRQCRGACNWHLQQACTRGDTRPQATVQHGRSTASYPQPPCASSSRCGWRLPPHLQIEQRRLDDLQLAQFRVCSQPLHRPLLVGSASGEVLVLQVGLQHLIHNQGADGDLRDK